MKGNEYQDGELNLGDYVKVLIKRKVTVILFFSICVATAVLHHFIGTENYYEVSQVIEMPTGA